MPQDRAVAADGRPQVGGGRGEERGAPTSRADGVLVPLHQLHVQCVALNGTAASGKGTNLGGLGYEKP
jgi:hypothetical protein